MTLDPERGGPREDHRGGYGTPMIRLRHVAAAVVLVATLSACSDSVAPPATTTAPTTSPANPKLTALMGELATSSSATLRALPAATAAQLATTACGPSTVNAAVLALDTMVSQGTLLMNTADIESFVSAARATFC